jgi:hypothetical protein
LNDRRSTGSIVAIVGGVALVIGAFLTWATVSINVQAFASLLGTDAGTLSGLLGDTSKSFSGLDAGADGRWALAMGILAVALGVVLLAWKGANKAFAVGIVLAGLIGGGWALYDITQVDNVKQDGINQAAPQLQALGVDTSTLGDVFDISLGVGIWVCTFGGLIAIAGGAMVLTTGDDDASTAEPPPIVQGADTGFSSPPATPAATMTPARTMTPAPPAMPSSEPSPPAGGNPDEPSSGGEPGGGT